jgi:hypothetical protein
MADDVPALVFASVISASLKVPIFEFRATGKFALSALLIARDKS